LCVGELGSAQSGTSGVGPCWAGVACACDPCGDIQSITASSEAKREYLGAARRGKTVMANKLADEYLVVPRFSFTLQISRRGTKRRQNYARK